MHLLTASSISRMLIFFSARALRTTTGLLRTNGGKSHSWVTPISCFSKPMAQTISVAEGRKETRRKSFMPSIPEGKSSPTQVGYHAVTRSQNQNPSVRRVEGDRHKVDDAGGCVSSRGAINFSRTSNQSSASFFPRGDLLVNSCG